MITAILEIAMMILSVLIMFSGIQIWGGIPFHRHRNKRIETPRT